MTIEWKCWKLHLLIYCAIDSQDDSFWIVMIHKPHPSDTPCRLKQTNETVCIVLWWKSTNDTARITLRCYTCELKHNFSLVSFKVHLKFSDPLQISLFTSVWRSDCIKMELKKKMCWNVCGEEKASCAAPRSLSEAVLRKLLKVSTAAQIDKSEPRAAVHLCFDLDNMFSQNKLYTSTHIERH